jgi:hypothetical protein
MSDWRRLHAKSLVPIVVEAFAPSLTILWQKSKLLKHLSGAKALRLLSSNYGTTKVVPYQESASTINR